MNVPEEKLIPRSSFKSSNFEDRLPSLLVGPLTTPVPLQFLKNCPHRALPASFFNLFSLARLFKNKMYF